MELKFYGIDYEKSRMYDRYEHWSAFAEGFFLLALGVSYTYLYMTGKITLQTIPFLVIIFWTLKDGFLNIRFERNFFYVSETSGSPIEKISTWYVKLILFTISLLIIWI